MNDGTAITTRKNDIMASATTATLVASLLKIDGMGRKADLSTARRLLIEEIEVRHPEVNAAMDAWAEDVDGNMTYVDALIAALPFGGP